MTKYRDAGHVEQIDPEESPPSPGRSWYLPIFPVVHKKRGKTRLVFDSSAKYKGASLNYFLLQGPNNNNRLKGVLLRFRNGPFAVSCDIEMMFHSFKLSKEDRNYVRFFFFRDLDPAKELTEYRMKSHCFGNTASPAVANFGLRMAAMSPQFDDLLHGRAFLLNHVYVDDGLGASDSAKGAALMVREAREILSSHKIRLHKIVSNQKEVLKDFPASEIAPLAFKSVGIEEYDTHSALGILWDVTADKLSLQFSLPNCPFTKRRGLALVNSIFDPLGIASPVVLSGRLLQREIFMGAAESKFDWDDPQRALRIEDPNS